MKASYDQNPEVYRERGRNFYHRSPVLDILTPPLSPPTTKTCCRCHLELPLEDFYIRKITKDGLTHQCKSCWDNRNKEEIRLAATKIRQKSYRESNKEKLKAHRKEYRKIHSDLCKERVNRMRFGPVSFERFGHKLTIDEDPTHDLEGNLQVRCTYCGRRYTPSRCSVSRRIKFLSIQKGANEARLYCSDGCKEECPLFRSRGAIHGPNDYTREVQPYLRKIVLQRDGYKCQIGNDCSEDVLHCHHFEGLNQNPIESADTDNCITLCKKHHKWVHTKEGCTRNDLRKCKSSRIQQN